MGSHSEMKKYIKGLIKRYEFSFIPLRLVDDNQIKSGKIPAINKWTSYCDELPDDEEIDSWNIFGELSGVGICCGEASNLCCIDIDTEDKELARRLVNILPKTARIVGNPKRAGKFLFKLREFPNDEIVAIKSKAQFKDVNGNVIIDILVSGCQIAVPPSTHSVLEDGEEVFYKWGEDYRAGEYPSHDDLPVLTDHILTAIKQTIDGLTPTEIAHSLPLNALETGKGRYDYIKTRICQLQHQRVGIDDAINTLIKEDMDRHGLGNLMTLSKLKYTKSSAINVLKMYTDMLIQNNSSKTLEACEIPMTLIDPSKDIRIYDEKWNKPQLPDDERPLIPPFDLNVVPDIWRDLVSSVAEVNSVPAEVCFFILLTQLSGLIGNKKLIQAKHMDKEWLEAHNIWSIYISKSGTRKTQLLKILGEPMRRMQKGINEQHRKSLAEVERQKEVVEPQVKELEKRLKQEALDAVDNPSNKDVIVELQLKIEQLRKLITEPKKAQLVIRSATTERFMELLAENQEGIMLVFNELSELLAQFSKRGYETHRTVLMNSWDGTMEMSHQTKTAGEVFAEKTCTSMYASIQQSLFEQEMLEIYHGKHDDGFWQRSFIVFNENNERVRATDKEFDHARHQGAYDIFHKAFELEESDNPIRTTVDAYDEYMLFEDRSLRMLHEESNSAISSFWGKYTGKIVKLASMLEFVKNNGIFPKEITLESIRQAVYIMDRQTTHVRRIFPKSGIYGLEEVIDLIRSGIIQDGIAMRDLERQQSKYFKKASNRNALLAELEARHIIKTEKSGKSIILRISPYVF